MRGYQTTTTTGMTPAKSNKTQWDFASEGTKLDYWKGSALTQSHLLSQLPLSCQVLPGGKLVLANMTRGEGMGSGIYERLYRLSPALMGGCRGVQLSEVLRDHGFTVQSREYFQQMLFPSEVILAVNNNI